MSKSHEFHRQEKRKPLLTPKEKKAAKLAKKLAREAPAVPVIIPH